MRSKKEIQAEIAMTKAKLELLYEELRTAQMKLERDNRNSYQTRKAMLEETAVLFAKLLKPGDFVKVTGSRASPYRKIAKLYGSSFVGAVCRFSKTNAVSVDETDFITCGLNKITAVFLNDKWMSAKEFLDNSVDNSTESV
jgi:hypothetical protein